MSIRIVLVDDHTLFRHCLRELLAAESDLEVIGEAGTGRQAIDEVLRLQPDVVLMDVLMPELDGLRATQMIHDQQPDIRIVILSSLDEEAAVVAAVRAGATGYVRKDEQMDVLLCSIRAAGQSKVHFSPRASARLVQELHTPMQEPDRPTRRELEVLELVARGLPNKEIASALSISEQTVKSHVHSLMDKFGLESRTQVAIYATRIGLVSVTALGAQAAPQAAYSMTNPRTSGLTPVRSASGNRHPRGSRRIRSY